MTSPDGLSVRDVAARLGVPSATLRTWERRYGLAPSSRSAGGHRRYSEADVGRLGVVARLVADGVPVHSAVAAIQSDPDVTPAGVGRAAEHISGDLVSVLLAAAARRDGVTVRRHVDRVLTQRGVVRAWDEVLVPLLQSVGERWRDPSFGIAGEHLTSEMISTSLRLATVRASRHIGDADPSRVLLANAEEEQHALPLSALEAALAEDGIGCRAFGARVPSHALADEMRGASPDAVFLWASMRRPDLDVLDTLAGVSRQWSVLILLGGPGWGKNLELPDLGAVRVERTTDLGDAVARIREVARPR
jgi:DNA-binding transcriptional MerR regulator